MTPDNEKETSMPDQRCSLGNCLIVTDLPGGRKKLWSDRRPWDFTEVDSDEWVKHLADVKAGRYDPKPAPVAIFERRNAPMPAAELRDRAAAEEGA